MNCRRGNVVLVLYPDSNLRTSKRRPALVVQAEGLSTGLPQTIVAMITSNMAREQASGVQVIREFAWSIREHPVKSQPRCAFHSNHISAGREVVPANHRVEEPVRLRSVTSSHEGDRLSWPDRQNVGVAVTTRNWNTILAIVRILKDQSKKDHLITRGEASGR